METPIVRSFAWDDPEKFRFEFRNVYLNHTWFRPESHKEWEQIEREPKICVFDKDLWLEQGETVAKNLDQLVERLLKNNLIIRSVCFVYHPTFEDDPRYEVMVILEIRFINEIGKDWIQLKEEFNKFFGFDRYGGTTGRAYDPVLDDSLDCSECSWHWERMGVTALKLVLNEMY